MIDIIWTLILATFFLLLWWYSSLKKYSGINVAGPTPLPLIGSAYLLGNTTVDLLHSFMKLVEKYGGIIKLWIGPRLHLVITDPKYVEFFLSSTSELTKSDGYDLFKPWLGDGLLVSTGTKWKLRRKMITPTFHFKILEQFLDTFNNQVDTLLDVLSEEIKKTKGTIEIHHYVNLCSLDIICETSFGTSINAQKKSNPKYVEAVTGFLEIFTMRFFSAWKRHPLLFRLSPMYPKYKAYLKILHSFTTNIIKQRKDEFALLKKQGLSKEEECGIKKRAALLDMLLEVSDNGNNLSDEDIREEVDTFMFEGHDTISSAICFVLYALVKNPVIQEKVYEELINILGPEAKSYVTYSQLQDLKYLDMVIKEALRIYPPVPLIERTIEEDVKIENMTIPKYTNISIFLYGMSYSEETFSNPKKFDPERFLPEKQSERNPYAYVPFSAGPRNCIGQKFAILELKATLAKFLRHFEMIEDKNFAAQVGMCSVLKSRNGIRMYLKRRNSE